MYTMQPGQMARHAMWDEVSATEMLMLNQMFWRVAHRLERMKIYEFLERDIANEWLDECHGLINDTMFETAIRLVPDGSTQRLLMHTAMHEDSYWKEPATPT